MSHTKPRAWMRKWAFDGAIPAKEKNENGHWVWPIEFKFLPVTRSQCLTDDIPLYAALDLEAK